MIMRPVLLISATIALAILIALGIWQMQRLAWKEGLIEAMAVRSTLTPLSPAAFVDAVKEGEDIEFFPVRLEGQFDPDHQVRFVTSAISDPDRTDIYMPLDTAAGRLWVHVGIAGPGQRVIAPPPGAVGLVRVAARSNRFVPMNDPAANVWFWPDVAKMGTVQTATPGHYLALQPAFDSQSDRFTLNNPRAAPQLSNNHLGYALTWFGMAAGLIVIVALMMRRRPATGRS
jgi:surfeit locus 1 family protein